MATKRKKSRKRSKARRTFPWHKKTRKARRKRSKSRRKARSHKGRRIRPVVIVSGGKFHRPKRSKHFKRPTRINGRRRRRSNPGFSVGGLKRLFALTSIMRFMAIGGGLLGGTLLSRFLNSGAIPFMAPPASVPGWVQALQKVRPVHGLIHILAGTLLASKVRNKHLKDVGLGMAALGGFDLLMQGLSAVGVKGLPTFSGMNINMLGMNVPGGLGTGILERDNGVLSGLGSYDSSPNSLADCLPG